MTYGRGRYGRPGRYRYSNWGEWHQSKLDIVRRNFGGIDQDVRQAFFRLSSREFEAVLDLYAQRYGKSAAKYARTAYTRWRRGSTMMSGQTLERLLEVVPYVLGFETKLDLYRKLRDAHRPRETIRVKLTGGEDIALVEASVQRIVERAQAVPLPPIVDQRLVWLAQGDGLVARQLVAASEEAEGATIASSLHSELVELQRLFGGLEPNHTLEHVIALPCGTVTVEFARQKKRWFMSENDESQQGANLPAKREDQLPTRPPKDIFEFALQSMISPDDSQEIVLAAQREYLRLQAKKVEGEMDAQTAEKELQQFIAHMREANHLQNVSMQADADFKRASGTTRMTFKKGRKWWPF